MGGWLEEGEGPEQRPGGWGRELTPPPPPPVAQRTQGATCGSLRRSGGPAGLCFLEEHVLVFF